MYTEGYVSCFFYVNKVLRWWLSRNALPYNRYKHSQHYYHAQWCSTTKVTFELKLQIRENWRSGHPNAPLHEYAGPPHMTVYQPLKFSTVLYDINGNYTGLKTQRS